MAQVHYQMNRGSLDSSKAFIDSLLLTKATLYYEQAAYDALAQYFYYSGYMDSSEHYFNRAMSVAKERNDSNGVVAIMVNISTVYAQQGNTEKELELLLEVVKYEERVFKDEPIEVVGTYINLGQCYVALESGDEAVAVLKKGINILKKYDRPQYYSYTANAMGDAYFILEDYKKSQRWFLRALKVADEHGYFQIQAAATKNVGDTYARLGKPDSAGVYYEQSLEYWKQLGDPFQLLHTEIYYADVLNQQGDYQKALDLLEKNRSYIDSTDYDVLKDGYFENLSNAYAGVGEYEKALELMHHYVTIKDSLHSRQSSSRLAEMRTKFKAREIEQENKALVARAETTRTIYISLVTGLALTLLLLAIVFYQRRRHHRKIIENKNKIMSIIAHDLKGPIGSITGLLEMMDGDNLDEETLKIARTSARSTFNLLDQLLVWARGNQLSTKAEKEKHNLHIMVSDVISVLQSNITLKTININNKVPDGYLINCIKSLSDTILRNLINNAVKFTRSGGNIIIDAKRDGRFDVISITDNGVGMPQELIEKINKNDKIFSSRGTEKEEGTGLGLRIVKDFVQGQNGKLTIESELDKGTTFKIWLPVK